MARNKEGLVLLIDVSPSMHSVLPEIQKVCSLLIQKKLVYSKYDEVGVVVFGTEDTKNDLTTEVGGYEHVTVLQPIKVVDGDLVDVVQQLPLGTASGDFAGNEKIKLGIVWFNSLPGSTMLDPLEIKLILIDTCISKRVKFVPVMDAIVVGMDLLIKKFQDTIKGKKRICLITNAMYPIKDPYEGTKEDQVYTLAEQMYVHGMKIECIIYRGNQKRDPHEDNIIEENDRLLNIFSKKTKAKAVHVESSTSLLGALRTRNVTPVTTYRGDLEISSTLKIKVWVYKKTAEERFPTLKKYSDKAPSTDKFATHEIKLDYEYKSVQDHSKVVPPEQRIKGYRYGPQVIPISSAEFEAVKFRPEKSVKLLGFTNASNVMRHYYMKDVNIFIADPGNKKAIIAVSALARTMKEMNKVAILRCVWRQGQANVVIGVLTPNVSDKDNIADSFYFNVLPFAEDIREFQFPSFNSLPASLQPNAEQQEAADKLVMMLDLALAGKEESLQPEFTPNPVLERFYHHLELKSKHPDAAVPPLDESLKRITEPDPEVISTNKLVIDQFRRHFELKENPKLKKSTRRLLRDKTPGSYENQSTDLIASTSEVKIETLGDLTAVSDFEAMISRRDSPEWVSKAIYAMKNKILDLVENSFEGDNYPKALECLIALRRGCVIEQEPEQFNNFLRHINRFCQETNLSSFFEFLASKDVTYITKTEAKDSEIEEQDARSLFVKPEPNS